MAKLFERSRRQDPEMLAPLTGSPSVRVLRRWLAYLLAATALVGLSAYTLLLYSPPVTPTHVEQTVRWLRSLPNDFERQVDRRDRDVESDKIITDTLTVVDGLRLEFERQIRESETGYAKWLMSPFSIARDALLVSMTRTYPTCRLSETDRERYASLRDGGRIFIAINLLENEVLMPTLSRELIKLLQELGPHRVYVSIYENASMDLTVMQLRLLCRMLDSLGTPYRVFAHGLMELQQKEHGHRISRLARLRNAVLDPLFPVLDSNSTTEPFETVLFLNDVFHCHGDVLELLLQKKRNNAVQACGLDFGPRALVYDRWVLRTMRGTPFYRQSGLLEFFGGSPYIIESKVRPAMLPEKEDAEDRAAVKAGNPFQVFSCWNGVSAITASAFAAPISLRFRTARNDPESEDGVTDKESECYLSSVDLWRAQLGRVMVVPRVRTAYSLDVYEADRASSAYSTPAGTPPFIQWNNTPPQEVVMHNFAVWYAPEVKEPWDEA